jgi:hypothetical protein
MKKSSFVSFAFFALTAIATLLPPVSYCSESRFGGPSIASPVQGKDSPCNAGALKCPRLPHDSSSANEFMRQLATNSRQEGEQLERTVGMCMHGVSQALGKACNGTSAEQTGICGNASGSGKCLRAMGFQECEFTEANRDQRQDDVQDPKHPLVGAIFVYSGGPEGNGHIEVYTGNLKWCSDHCSMLPMQSKLRVPLAIYLPPGATPPADWTCVSGGKN